MFHGIIIIATVLQLGSALEAEINQVVKVRNKSFSCLFKIHYEDDTCYDDSTVSCSPNVKKKKNARNVELVLENGTIIKIDKLTMNRKKDRIIGCKATNPAITTTTQSTQGCPEARPEPDSWCGQQGLDCDYGKQECCGEIHPEVSAKCSSHSWAVIYIHTRCMFGYPCSTTALPTTTTSTPITSFGTTTATAPYPGVQLSLGGDHNPQVKVTKNGKPCKSVNIPDVPQPYGEYGRIGSYATTWGSSAMVCGGYSGGGPPFSVFKECQILDLVTKTWSLGPKLVNYTASADTCLDVSTDHLYIFGGGSYPSNFGPRPGFTQWRDHDIIQVLDLNNLGGGWSVVQQVEDTSGSICGQGSTNVNVPSQFFPSCFEIAEPKF